jgi:hypothetical protein
VTKAVIEDRETLHATDGVAQKRAAALPASVLLARLDRLVARAKSPSPRRLTRLRRRPAVARRRHAGGMARALDALVTSGLIVRQGLGDSTFRSSMR